VQDVSEIKLIRTDTTLDLGQKAEKVCPDTGAGTTTLWQDAWAGAQASNSRAPTRQSQPLAQAGLQGRVDRGTFTFVWRGSRPSVTQAGGSGLVERPTGTSQVHHQQQPWCHAEAAPTPRQLPSLGPPGNGRHLGGLMRRGLGQAGNRAAKTSHSCQWREHAAEWCRCWPARHGARSDHQLFVCFLRFGLQGLCSLSGW